MGGETLVIDVGDAFVRRTPWWKAIVSVLIDRTAEVVSSYPDRYIHTPNPLHYCKRCPACNGDASRKVSCMSCGGSGKMTELSRVMPDCHQLDETRWRVRMPSVIRLVRPVSHRRGVRFSRSNVYARDFGKCQYCPARVPFRSFTLDHVVPRAQGGRTGWTNVVVACAACNQQKGARTPEQAGMVLRTKPVRPKVLMGPTRSPLAFRPDMPKDWERYLRDVVYWDGELEHDE